MRFRDTELTTERCGHASYRCGGKTISDFGNLEIRQHGIRTPLSALQRFRMQSRAGTVSASRSALGLSIVHVVLMRAYKQMRRVDARLVIARVAHMKAVRNLTVRNFPGDDVRRSRHASNTNLTVPRWERTGRPDPTRPKFGSMLGNRPILIDLGPEALREIFASRFVAASLRAKAGVQRLIPRELRSALRASFGDSGGATIGGHSGLHSVVSRLRSLTARGGISLPQLYPMGGA